MSAANQKTLFRIAQHKTKLEITPQDLRFWFANEIARLNARTAS
jgi:hypothetical protein